MYLFDTDILSNLMKRTPPRELLDKVRSVPADQQFTSSITLGELTYGAKKKVSARLEKKIREHVTQNLPILPYDAEAATRYGDIRASMERRGRQTGDSDLKIASIALVRGLIVVTGNVRHFRLVPGLSFENWL